MERDNCPSSREMGELSIRLDMIADKLHGQSQDKIEIYRRLGTLENRMAQVTIVAALAAVVLPVALSIAFKG